VYGVESAEKNLVNGYKLDEIKLALTDKNRFDTPRAVFFSVSLFGVLIDQI
jgi:hypothetical protein